MYGGVDVELHIIAPYMDDTWLRSLRLIINKGHNNGGMIPMLFKTHQSIKHVMRSIMLN